MTLPRHDQQTTVRIAFFGHRLLCLAFAAALLLGALDDVRGEAKQTANWPQWRGPHRDGVTSEPSGWTGQKWPLTKVWQKHFGAGPTSPLLVDGRVYLMDWEDNKDRIHCLDVASGESIWRQSYAAPRYGSKCSGPRGYWGGGPLSTPAFDEASGLLYTVSCDGDLNCWDSKDKGKHKWGFNLIKRYHLDKRKDARDDYWGDVPEDEGIVCSPLLLKDWVIVEPGSERDGEVMAFHKRTGERVWSSQYKDCAGHSSPIALTVDGKPCVAALALNNLVLMRADPSHEGKTIGTVRSNCHAGHNIVTPVAVGNKVLTTANWNVQKTRWIEVKANEVKVLWEQKLVSCKVSTPVIYKDRIYGYFAIGVDATRRQTHRHEYLACLELASGKVVWKKELGLGDDSTFVATGDGKLIVASRDTLRLVDIADSPNECKQLARVKTGVGGWDGVIVANGYVVCKGSDGDLVCFKIEGVPHEPPHHK